MKIHELKCPIELETPQGRGMAFLVTEYGWEQPKLFTCIIQDTGEIWEFPNNQVRATKNITFGRTYDGTKKAVRRDHGHPTASHGGPQPSPQHSTESIDRVWAFEPLDLWPR